MNENDIEQYALELLSNCGWSVQSGGDLTRSSFADVILRENLESAILRLNPTLPKPAVDEVIKRIGTNSSNDAIKNNREFHRLLTEGVDVEYRNDNGKIVLGLAIIVDFETPENNDFLAVNQLTILQDGYRGDTENKRPDIVLFVNGLPIAVFELKNVASVNATLENAFEQLKTYQEKISDLFRFNEICVISDGIDAKLGTISSNFERFASWNTVDGKPDSLNKPQLETLIRGALTQKAIFDIAKNFTVFEDDKFSKKVTKKIAAYHQYDAVNRAINRTEDATLPSSDKKAGVIWHTQGSGKSLSMVFYAGKLIAKGIGGNPTLVVVTDRIDLDDQLFNTFVNCKDLLRQDPVQATSQEHLRKLLDRGSGGIIFTTIWKFAPPEGKDEMEPISDRDNIIVIADEAHRSQYGFKAREIVDEAAGTATTRYGNAKYMRDAIPNASYIGFTGTPIELDDRSTPEVFGEYIDIYDIKQAVKDGSTVPIYYESRLVDLGIDEKTKEWMDSEIDELLENENIERSENLKASAAQKEAVVGNPERLQMIAQDIASHFEERSNVFDGKAMVVTMSRKIAVDLFDKIIEIRPEWHNSNDKFGKIKLVMTGNSADPQIFQPHIRGRRTLKKKEERFKNPKDELKIVIVCDMWLTGFDVPNLTTMYLDKPLKSHNLMQAIARVNRVYPNKEGGLVVDYLGVAAALRDALNTYTRSGGEGAPTLDIETAIVEMQKRYEIMQDFFHGFEFGEYFQSDTRKKLSIILDAQEFVLEKTDGCKTLAENTSALYKAFSIVVPAPEAIEIRERVAFFQAVNARILKLQKTSLSGPSDADYRAALKQVVDKAVAPIGIVNVFEAAGLQQPQINILSDDFIAEIRNMERKNLAVVALEKLLSDEIHSAFGRNVVKKKAFSKLLEETLNRYKNGAVEAAMVIEQLIELAKKMRDEKELAKSSNLSEDERLFYDALIENESAQQVLQDDKLRDLARVLVQQVRKDASIDWQYRNSVQAKLRVKIKQILKKYGYPPDKQALATDLVLEQAKAYADIWSAQADEKSK